MLVRLGIVAMAVWASLACATPHAAAPPPEVEAAPRKPPAAPPLVSLCTMDEDCPQGQHCCEQMGSPVCCAAR